MDTNLVLSGLHHCSEHMLLCVKILVENDKKFEIVMKEKFPSPVIRILDLKILEREVYEGRTTFSIYCDKSGLVLKTSDDNSNSSYESVNTHNYDSMDESVENSDSFSESDENSESMDESDKDSEIEDRIYDPDHNYWNNGMIN